MTLDICLDILKESIILTFIVMGLMVMIEAFNFSTKGRLMDTLHKSHAGQIIASSIFGAIPGCVGGYIVVSMYSKKMFSFGALLAMALATTGDEAFVMLASFPKEALLLFLGLTVFAIAAGFIRDAINTEYIDKDSADCDCKDSTSTDIEQHNSLKHRLLHTVKHGLRIFAWTFCIMMAVSFIDGWIDLNSWISSNIALSIIIAALIGCIPQSGPHMVFITLYASGVLPFPILLASCLSQDGHAGLPLIAASRKSFLKLKIIKLGIAIGAGFLAMLF